MDSLRVEDGSRSDFRRRSVLVVVPRSAESHRVGTGIFDSRGQTCHASPAIDPNLIMKNPLQVLLIFLSLCLCALIAFQWHRETKMRQEVQALTDSVQNKLEIIQNQQAAQKHADEEIKRLDGLKSELTETVKSNRTEIARVKKDLEKSEQEIEKGLKQIETFKGALQKANDSIRSQNDSVKAQNESIKVQNENLKKLADEHSELVAKYNKVVADFNDLAKKWNDAQAAAAAAAANPPAKK